MTMIEISKDQKKRIDPIKRGERGEFVRVTIMMSVEMRKKLKEIGVNMQQQGFFDYDVSAIVRDAIRLKIQEYEKVISLKIHEKG